MMGLLNRGARSLLVFWADWRCLHKAIQQFAVVPLQVRIWWMRDDRECDKLFLAVGLPIGEFGDV